MPNTTTNLGLYKKNPATDGNDTFDITTMLNDNWDRLDAQLGAQVVDAAPTAVNLVNGLQVVDVPQTAPLENLRITGRTLVNLLGRDGNCEDMGRWSSGAAVVVREITNKVYGDSSIKLTSQGSLDHYRQALNIAILPNKYYVLIGEVRPVVGKAALRLVTYTSTSSTVKTPYTNIISDTTKFSISRIKFTTTSTEISAQVRLQLINSVNADVFTAAGESSFFDGIRLYEVSQTDYNEFDTLTDLQVEAKYPYVDDLKHITAPYVLRYGENLLAQVNQMNFNGGAIAGAVNTINGPYQLTVDSTGAAGGSEVVNEFPSIPLAPNTSYTLINPSTTGYMRCRFDYLDGSISTRMVFAPNSSRTFTTPSNIKLVVMVTSNLVSYTDENNPATYVFGQNVREYSNPLFTVGSIAKPFKPRNDDMLTFPNIQLASSVDGTVYDTLFERDGKYFVDKRFKDVVLDGSFPWIYCGGGTGWKYVSIGSISNSIPVSQKLVKYDGKIIGETAPLTAGDQSDLQSNGFFYISIPSADSGWGDTYHPTTQDIQAYFYGWKMYDNVNTLNLYNSGTKAWVRISKIVNGVFTGIGGIDTTLTLPTSPSGAGYIPYKLTYQLATPTFNEIQVEGNLSLQEGLSQVEVGEGIVIREKANPSLNSVIGFAAINVKGSLNYNDSCALRYKLLRFRAIYKNGLLDTRWTIKASGGNGNFYADIPSDNYDQTATYEVSYIALDQYLLSAPVRTVSGETASNLKTVVDTLVMNDADLETRLSANEILAKQVYNVPQKTKANINLYVDSASGMDSNEGSAEKPFKTIQRAVNSVPQVVNHGVLITVASGTYAETITVSGFSGAGTLKIFGNNTNVFQCIVINNPLEITLQNLNMTVTNENAISSLNNSRLIVTGCAVIGSANGAVGINHNTGTCYASSCVISNRQFAFLCSVGKLISDNNIGTGNTYCIGASAGGEIVKYGTQPSGLENAIGGGIIHTTILSPWGDNTQSQRSHVISVPSAAQGFSANVATKVLYGIEQVDNLGEYDQSLSRFISKTGWSTYLISGLIQFNSGMSTSTAITMSIYKNGTIYRNIKFDQGSASSVPQVPFLDQMDLNTNDYIELYLTCSVTCQLGTGSYLIITRIA